MGEDIIRWLQLPSLWLALGLGFAPALIARFKRLPTIRWYLYGFACALVAWPLAALPTLHALVAVGRPRHRLSEQDRQRQRRADALALLAESSVVSYPSRIAELRRKSPAGIDRRHYAYEHIGPGEPLELVREPTNGKNDRAVAYYHHGVHLGYVPKRQRWIADALDDGLHLVVVAEKIRMGWIFRHRATSVGTRIVVLPNGR